MSDTIKFETPITKKEVILRAWITGAIDDEIQRIVRRGYDYSIGIETPKTEAEVEEAKRTGVVKTKDGQAKIDSVAELDAEKRAIELMVISFDGSSDNVMERIYELPKGDTQAIKDKINEITEASNVSPKVSGTSKSSTS